MYAYDKDPCDSYDPCGAERKNPSPQELAAELDAWFAVSGDMDDFIYFGDNPKAHSEK